MRLLFSILCTLGVLCPPVHAAAPPRPNVIVVLTDDQGYGDLSCHGNSVLKTPSLDRLYAESVRLTDFHVAPMCTPTRAQLISGRDALDSGAMNVSSGRTLLRRDLPTMADVFAAAGYRTGVFGKWHLGDAYPYRPQDRGFQESLWFPSSHIGAVPDAWNNDYFNDTYRHNERPRPYEGYCTDVFFREATAWIRKCREAGEPFLAYIPLNAAHWPHFVPDQYRERYEQLLAGHAMKPQQRDRLARFFGMLANIDENLGMLDGVLRETGLRDDTILVFLTDNGGTVGVPFFNAGMKGAKVTLWEGGHRVPCFVRWPAGGIGGGRDVDELTHCQDLLPTLVELCGLKTPPGASFDGVSLAGLLRGTADRLADRMLVVQFSRMNAGRPQKGDAAVLWRKWRLVAGTQLFDLAEDPAQSRNVLDQHPDVAARMRAHYDQWWAEIEPQLDAFQPVSIGSPEENPTMLTACEWADVFLDQGVQVRRGERKNGAWHVRVEREGEYQFTLRRWPRDVSAALREGVPAHHGELGDYDAGVALPIAKARLRVGDHDVSQPVRPDDREATFTLRLPRGRTTLQTWFYDDAGQEICGAYYVYAYRP
ncbi:MAG TPA: arylsulfatase [Thermoguttaceae bacterium]|nr:arylsulfatase [Thermoguttaceae bacterium]